MSKTKLNKSEFDALLVKEFPEMYRQMTLSPSESCLSFGVECSSGWFDMLYKLSVDIQGELKKLEFPYVFEVQQIKEKFGSLRFYYSFHSHHEEGSEGFADADRCIQEMVYDAEEASFFICEECGEKGEIRRDIGWIRTLCDKHHKEVLDRRL